MSLRPFAELPCEMQNDRVAKVYEVLARKKSALRLKRMFDVALALALTAALAPLMLAIAAVIRIDSPGGAIYRQKRVARYKETFDICKFRTMAHGAAGPPLTLCGDPRITRAGRWLRRSRLDELPQLFNILRGDLSFVGPRPEAPRYVERYDEAMLATLLMPAGMTSLAAILFKDEDHYLDTPEHERVYCDLILPRKAALNLDYVKRFSLAGDVGVLLKTVSSLIFPRG